MAREEQSEETVAHKIEAKINKLTQSIKQLEGAKQALILELAKIKTA